MDSQRSFVSGSSVPLRTHPSDPADHNALKIEGQPVAITVWGTIGGTASVDGKEIVSLKLEADLSDLQRQIAPILKAQLNQDNRCGERMSLEQAALTPDAPGAPLARQRPL